MCLIHFQWQDHPYYKLIVAANRDEFYERPTAEAQFWEGNTNILAGRDLQQMGTWLGITRNGRFAALTNFREPAKQNKQFTSRGDIVRGYLEGKTSPELYLAELHKYRDRYDGFNMLAGGPDTLLYYSNRREGVKEVTEGVHGLSNHLLDTPWPKVERGKQRLEAYTKQTEKINPDELFQIMLDTEKAEEGLLPYTGVSRELEKKLSASFIQMPDYGTRASTVLLIDKANRVTFAERTYDRAGYVDEKRFQFQIEESR